MVDFVCIHALVSKRPSRHSLYTNLFSILQVITATKDFAGHFVIVINSGDKRGITQLTMMTVINENI